MPNTSRRRFIHGSALAVTLLGGGVPVAAESSTIQSENEIPAYADWIGDQILSESANSGPEVVTCVDTAATLEASQFSLGQEQGERSESGRLDPSASAFAVSSHTVVQSWHSLSSLGLLSVVIGIDEVPTADGGADSAAQTETLTNRELSYGPHTVYLGSYDPAAIEATVESREELSETGTDGVYSGEDRFGNELFVRWTEEYVIVSESISAVERLEAVKRGEQSRRFEVDDEFARLIRTVGNHDFVEISQSGPDQSRYDQADLRGVDTTPYENVVAFGVGNDFHLAEETIDATVELAYQSEDDVDTRSVGLIGQHATDRNQNREGGIVTVTMQFSGENWFYGARSEDFEGSPSPPPTPTPTPSTEDTPTPSPSDEDTPTPEPADPSTPTESVSTSTPSERNEGSDEKTPDGTTDTEATDDDTGAGFGLVSALLGLGGAGYMISRRAREEEKP